jgi:hypothetical protein
MLTREATTRTWLVAELDIAGQEERPERDRRPVPQQVKDDEIAKQCLLREIQLPLEHSPLYDAFA